MYVLKLMILSFDVPSPKHPESDKEANISLKDRVNALCDMNSEDPMDERSKVESSTNEKSKVQSSSSEKSKDVSSLAAKQGKGKGSKADSSSSSKNGASTSKSKVADKRKGKHQSEYKEFMLNFMSV